MEKENGKKEMIKREIATLEKTLEKFENLKNFENCLVILNIRRRCSGLTISLLNRLFFY